MEKQKQVLTDLLKDHGKFDAALEMAEDIGNDRVRAWLIAQTLLARSRTLEKSDRVAALKDQLEAMELANSIRDEVKVLSIHYDVGLGQIRMGPVEAARLTIQASIESLKESEQSLPLQIVVQEWLHFGKLCLLADDDRNAEECFDRARQIYVARFRGKDWDYSAPNQVLMRYRYEAHRENKRPESITELMADWEQAFAGMTVAKEISFAAPYLISAQVQTDRIDQAAAVIQSLDEPSQELAIQKAADQIRNSASAAQKKWFANYVKTRQTEDPQRHLTMLVVAAELFQSADDKPSTDALIGEILAISASLNIEYHSMIADWLSANGRFKQAYDVIGGMENSKPQAQTLAELAYQMTKPKRQERMPDVK
jgi:hypothetical protein